MKNPWAWCSPSPDQYLRVSNRKRILPRVSTSKIEKHVQRVSRPYFFQPGVAPTLRTEPNTTVCGISTIWARRVARTIWPVDWIRVLVATILPFQVRLSTVVDTWQWESSAFEPCPYSPSRMVFSSLSRRASTPLEFEWIPPIISGYLRENCNRELTPVLKKRILLDTASTSSVWNLIHRLSTSLTKKAWEPCRTDLWTSEWRICASISTVSA